jgi:hypothetical protein
VARIRRDYPRKEGSPDILLAPALLVAIGIAVAARRYR